MHDVAVPQLGAEPAGSGPGLQRLRRVYRNPRAVYGLGIGLALVVIAVFAPVLTPYNPHTTSPAHGLALSSAQHLLGTDQGGRDLLSEVIAGTRSALSVAFLAIGIALAIAVPLGLASGYFGGPLDVVLMRVADAMLSLPSLLLALTLVTMLGNGLMPVAAGISTALVPLYLRLARARARQLRSADYVTAGIAVGASPLRILRLHVLPNAATPLSVQATIDLGHAIQLEAALGFLGFGLGDAATSWGGLLNQGFRLVGRSPNTLLVISLLLVVATSGFTFAGQAFDSLLSPARSEQLRAG